MDYDIIFIEEELEVEGLTLIKIGFKGFIERDDFLKIAQIMKNHDSYYLSDEKSWFIPKLKWKKFLSKVKFSLPYLFNKEENTKQKLSKLIRNKTLSAMNIKFINKKGK